MLYNKENKSTVNIVIAIDLLNNLNEREDFIRFEDKVMRLNLKNKDWS